MKTLKLRKIDYRQFENENLTGIISLPKVKEIGGRAFYNSSFEGAINFPKCKWIGASSFENSNFTSVYDLRKVERIESYAFENSKCTGTLEIPNCNFIGGHAFANSEFSKIIIADDVHIEGNSFGKKTDDFIEVYKSTGKKGGSYSLINGRWQFDDVTFKIHKVQFVIVNGQPVMRCFVAPCI